MISCVQIKRPNTFYSSEMILKLDIRNKNALQLYSYSINLLILFEINSRLLQFIIFFPYFSYIQKINNTKKARNN